MFRIIDDSGGPCALIVNNVTVSSLYVHAHIFIIKIPYDFINKTVKTNYLILTKLRCLVNSKWDTGTRPLLGCNSFSFKALVLV